MLIAGQEHLVTFKVNVMGTSIEPMVRLVLGGYPLTSNFSFTASKSADTWSAKVAVPESLPAGDYDLKVEVVLNNRLFTPLVKKVTVARQEEAAPVQTVEPEDQAIAAEPPPEVVQFAPELPSDAHTISAPSMTSVLSPTDIKSAVVPPVEKEVPSISLAKSPEKPVVKKFMFSFEDTAPPSNEQSKETKSIVDEINTKPKKVLENLKTVAEKEPKKKFAPIKTPLPDPTEVQPANIGLKFGDVVKIAEKKEEALPQKSPKKKQVAPVVEIKHELPTTLVKGEIIYE